ncbi:histidine-rich glycoprotein isoform X1 [Canis lupus familiaris]|uniref:histidine-rich glycoprotein isoform X1 n=1 Tax=Canis lupus familiaris TaxID=9615 RepID=UPI0018F7E041|nr:histidine-rich glycoprotein isoform X1 [Canis lupus familiaris]
MYYSKGWFSHFHKMRAFPAALLLLPLVALPSSCAVIPTDCDATESFAEKALDLINKGRRHGYLFQLLRVADAHVDESESVAVYYLVLDVKESDCSVLSRKHWNDCKPALSARLSDIVIGQCKVIATKCLNESQYLRVNDFNCTTSSVSSALANTKDSSILFDFFEDTQPYRTQADKALEKYKQENGDFASFKVDRLERVVRARGGERTNYYVDFSVRNCSVSHHFHRHHNAFGFCRADLSYDIEVSDLESPKDIAINCEVFNFAEHRNFSGKHHHFGHPHGPPPHGPPPHGPPPHGHHPHGPCPHGRPPFGPPPHGHPPHGHHPHGHPPHGHHPHGPPPYKHHPHGPPPHGPPPHGPPPHEHHPHGHPPHGPPPHGPPPHEHHPHGHPPHGPPPHGPPLPMNTIPMDTLLMDPLPMDPLPMNTIPMDTLLMDPLPMNTIPMDTIPISIIPMTTISLTMGLVTYHPIARVPKITIARARAHHLSTQKKEVQVKSTFPSTGDKSDMFTDSLH